MTLIFSQKTLPELAWCQPHNLMNICSCKTKWIIWIAICHLAFVILCCLTNVWNSKPINIRHFHTQSGNFGQNIETDMNTPLWRQLPCLNLTTSSAVTKTRWVYKPVTWMWLCSFKFHHFEGVICIGGSSLQFYHVLSVFHFSKKHLDHFFELKMFPQSSPSFCRSVSLRENKDMENTQPFRIATSSKTAAPVGMADRWAMRWQERPKVEVIAPAVCKAWWFV